MEPANTSLHSFAGQSREETSVPEVKLLIDGGAYVLIESSNVTSIIDNGVGDISINFATPLVGDYIVDVKSDRSLDWEAIGKAANSCRIRFFSKEPSVVKIGFES